MISASLPRLPRALSLSPPPTFHSIGFSTPRRKRSLISFYDIISSQKSEFNWFSSPIFWAAAASSFNTLFQLSPANLGIWWCEIFGVRFFNTKYLLRNVFSGISFLATEISQETETDKAKPDQPALDKGERCPMRCFMWQIYRERERERERERFQNRFSEWISRDKGSRKPSPLIIFFMARVSP